MKKVLAWRVAGTLYRRRKTPGKKEKPMRVKNKTLASVAVLALAGSTVLAGAAAPAGNAATVPCGPDCRAPYAREWGGNLMGAVLNGIPRAGQPAVLYPIAPRRAEDWRLLDEGTVASLYKDGILGAAVGQTWPSSQAYEYEYTPLGIPTSWCLGTATTAGPGTPLTLQTCGSTSKTLWIPLLADLSGGFVPLINGSDTLTTAPYVMTGHGPGADLRTARLVKIAGTVAPTQMWRNAKGVL
jgi:hypothetical protein